MTIHNNNLLPRDLRTLDSVVDQPGAKVARILGRVDRLLLQDRQRVHVYDFEVVVATGASEVTAHGDGVVYLLDTASCQAFGDVEVIALDKSSVTAHNRCRVVLGDQATGFLHHNAAAVVRDMAAASLYDSASASVHNTASAELFDQTRCEGSDMAQIVARLGTSVKLRGSAGVTVAVDDHVVARTESDAPLPGTLTVLDLTDSATLRVPHQYASIDDSGVSLVAGLSVTRTEYVRVQYAEDQQSPEEMIRTAPTIADGSYQLGGSPAEDWALTSEATEASGPIAESVAAMPGAGPMTPPTGDPAPQARHAAAPAAAAPGMPTGGGPALPGGGPSFDGPMVAARPVVNAVQPDQPAAAAPQSGPGVPVATPPAPFPAQAEAPVPAPAEIPADSIYGEEWRPVRGGANPPRQSAPQPTPATF